jgi:hypothetical protein
MALKGDRYELETDISHFMNDTTAERGGVASISTVGSGAALDQSAALVTYNATQSGQVPVGILLNDLVNVDQTRTHINFHKDEVQNGGKVTLLQKGWVVTNMIDPGVTIGPTVGQAAFVGPSGYITNTQATPSFGYGASAAGAFIGRFESLPDEDGYAKVSVNLPNYHTQVLV